ncbi:MAG: aminotransferase class I/II-fold pyridoxal phosphate-dependent enzyme [Methanomicrobiales archaeon]|nr:aminotransferase class I/II-fold pyridoxal phosphate-dependent enzyme [Methanomicrobiales archaeon]
MTIREFRLERFLAEREFLAPCVLGASDCETMSVFELLSLEPGSEDDLLLLRLGYIEPAGSPSLREAIAGLYRDVSPDEVITFNGASEGIMAFMNTAFRPGDHVIVQFPAYQSLYEVARSIGCDVTPWHMDEGRGWSPDLDLLQDLVRPATKAIVINSPHNPTGYQFPDSDLVALARFAEERGITIFSDEVYRLLEHRAADRLPAMVDLPGDHASLGDLSKVYGLAGLRIGWIATHDRGLLGRLARYKDYSTICNSVSSEFFAGIALRHHGRIAARNLEIVRYNIRLLERFFEKWSGLFSWVRPRAGSTAFPRLRAGIGAEEFCTDLLESTGILLVPGTVFEYDDAHIRFGYGRLDMPGALDRLDNYLETCFS